MEFTKRQLSVFLWLFIFYFESVVISQNFNSNQELDSRCFLNGGGSTLSFFVKESLPISSVVGRLDIQGDIESDIELILGKYIKIVFITDEIILKKL